MVESALVETRVPSSDISLRMRRTVHSTLITKILWPLSHAMNEPHTSPQKL